MITAGSSSKTASRLANWSETTQGIIYVVDGKVQFADDFDHFRNGFCRLLEVEVAKGKALVERIVAVTLEKNGKLPSELDAEVVAANIKEAVLLEFPPAKGRLEALGDAKQWGSDLWGKAADKVFAGSISGDVSCAVVGSTESGFAWLVKPESAVVVDPVSIEYDKAYFSDKEVHHYGMKQYLAHKDWRMEKARRLTCLVVDNMGKRTASFKAGGASTRILDIGSASGFFRAAFAELGFSHFGTELSGEMIQLASEGFGYETWQGGIFEMEEIVPKGTEPFHMITMWDVIEHLDRHKESLLILQKYLREDGVIVVRTPNLLCFEADVLGDMFYSYKFDHTSYFSVKSLNALMSDVGMEPVYMETSSHFFKGLLGANHTYKIGQDLYGADIVSVYGRKGK